MVDFLKFGLSVADSEIQGCDDDTEAYNCRKCVHNLGLERFIRPRKHKTVSSKGIKTVMPV